MADNIWADMRTRDFWISLTVALAAFLVYYLLPRALKRNV